MTFVDPMFPCTPRYEWGHPPFIPPVAVAPVPPGGPNFGVGVLVVDRGRFLVTTRKGGTVALPGGKIEFRESVSRAAARETLEETNLVVAPFRVGGGLGDSFHTGEWIDEDEHHVSLYVAAWVVGGTLANTEPDKHSPWRWVTVEEFGREVVGQGVPTWVPFDALVHYGKELGLTR